MSYQAQLNAIMDQGMGGPRVWGTMPTEREPHPVMYRGQTGDPDHSEALSLFGKWAPDESKDHVCFSASIKKYAEDISALARKGMSYKAGVTDTSITSTISALTVLDELLGVKFRNYRLNEAFRIVNSPTLELRADVATKFSGQARVLPLQDPNLQNLTYTRTTWDLAKTGKNVSHIAVADESMKQAAHDVFRMNIENAARELAVMENTQLEVLNAAATAVAGSDWGTYNTTHGESDNSPIPDLEGSMTTIWDNGFEPNKLIMHPKVWGEFIGNSRVRDTQIVESLKTSGDIASIKIVGFPTLDIIIDATRLNTSVVLASKENWCLLVRGPTEVAQYRNEIIGLDGYITRQWTEAKQLIAGAAREITGVQA